jgi:hypothetical protein
MDDDKRMTCVVKVTMRSGRPGAMATMRRIKRKDGSVDAVFFASLLAEKMADSADDDDVTIDVTLEEEP